MIACPDVAKLRVIGQALGNGLFKDLVDPENPTPENLRFASLVLFSAAVGQLPAAEG